MVWLRLLWLLTFQLTRELTESMGVIRVNSLQVLPHRLQLSSQDSVVFVAASGHFVLSAQAFVFPTHTIACVFQALYVLDR
jgi:hypothetical protein